MPMLYNTRYSSRRRVTVMISVVWVLSFAISCPLLFGLNNTGKDEYDTYVKCLLWCVTTLVRHWRCHSLIFICTSTAQHSMYCGNIYIVKMAGVSFAHTCIKQSVSVCQYQCPCTKALHILQHCVLIMKIATHNSKQLLH